MALSYILTMNPNLEAKDARGFTPLHIAVNQAPFLGSTRNVRVLLMKGADRNAVDNNDKRPIDWLPEDMPEPMKNELIMFLNK